MAAERPGPRRAGRRLPPGWTGGRTLKQVLFFSHAKKSYGTRSEERQLATITARFPGYEVFDPSKDELKFATEDEEMGHYLGLVDRCDALVFSRHNGVVTEGVLEEVNHALLSGKPVWEIRSRGRMVRITKPFPRSSKVDAIGYLLSELLRPRNEA